jgi:hypothetical protein
VEISTDPPTYLTLVASLFWVQCHFKPANKRLLSRLPRVKTHSQELVSPVPLDKLGFSALAGAQHFTLSFLICISRIKQCSQRLRASVPHLGAPRLSHSPSLWCSHRAVQASSTTSPVLLFIHCWEPWESGGLFCPLFCGREGKPDFKARGRSDLGSRR